MTMRDLFDKWEEIHACTGCDPDEVRVYLVAPVHFRNYGPEEVPDADLIVMPISPNTKEIVLRTLTPYTRKTP